MIKRVALCVVWVFCGIAVMAQISAKDESLSWKGKLKKADELMEQGSYYNAIDYYKAVLEEKPDEGDVAMKLANTLYAARNYREAQEYYLRAFEADNDDYRLAQFYYGITLKMAGQYEEAKEQFEDFRRSYRERGREAMLMKRLAKDEADGSDLALELLHDTLQMEVTHLSTNINDVYTEFSPRIVKKDSLLIYASLKIDSIPVLEKKSAQMPLAKLYQSLWSGQEWAKGVEMEGPFNDNKLHTGNGSFTRDGKRFYFTRCSDDRGSNVKCDIYMSERDESGDWSKPKKVPVNDKDYTSTHPIVLPYSRGDEMLLFASDREGSVGGLDLWYAVIDSRTGDLREPRNLGRRINTAGDELSPFYDYEEEILYFASNGHPNIGGYDIFKSKGSGRRWAKPLNAGVPINSSYDDFYYFHYDNGERGFIVSNRDGAISPKWPHCCDDIFAFEYIYPPVFTIIGNVYEKGDPEKKPIDSANVELFFADADILADTNVTADQEGFEFFRGTEFKNYRLEARKPGYTYGLNTTSTIGLTETDTIYVDIPITPIKDLQDPIVLRNVYFDLDKAYIREDAKPSLDTVYNILVKNPNIQIELSSHTDSRASKAYNKDLSQRRADSSKAYLVQKGIDPERIQAVGYGEEQLLNDCSDGVPCTDIEHQVNRRTEFKIIGEIPNTIITYDRSEIEEVQERKRQGTLKGDEDIWEFEEEDEGEEDF